MLSLDLHDKFSSSINTRRLSRWLDSGSSLSGSVDIKDSALWLQKSIKQPCAAAKSAIFSHIAESK